MHSRLLPTPKAPKSFWKVGLASALCQKAAFSVTQQTEGEAYCVSADTQVVAGKGRTNVQVNNQTKSTQYDTPYDDNISFFASKEQSITATALLVCDTHKWTHPYIQVHTHTYMCRGNDNCVFTILWQTLNEVASHSAMRKCNGLLTDGSLKTNLKK